MVSDSEGCNIAMHLMISFQFYLDVTVPKITIDFLGMLGTKAIQVHTLDMN